MTRRTTATGTGTPKGTRKRRTIIEESLPPSPEDEGSELTDFDVSLESVEDTETLREVLEQFGENPASFKIHRQTPQGPEFCYRTDTLDEEFIQKNYGGGEYIVRVYINGKFKKSIPIKIAPRILDNTDNPTRGGGDHHSAFLEKMLLAFITRDVSHAGTGTPGPTLVDLTTALSQLDAMRGKPESGLDMFIKGANFLKDMNEPPDADWKSTALKMAKDSLPDLMNIFNRRPVPPSPQVPGNTPEQPMVVAGDPQQTAMLKTGIQYLKQRFIGGMDPQLIVDWIASNAQDPTYQPLLHAVLTIPFEQFVTLDPEIGTEPFVQLFRHVYDGLRSAITATDTVDDDTGRNGGDVSNVGGNGKPRKEGSEKP